MTHDAPAPPRSIRATGTTLRGFATASFSLGLWGLIVFWWYPFGMTVATVGVLCGIGSLTFGIRAGRDGENLAALGIFLGATAIAMAVAAYRFMQMAFEQAVPRYGWSSEATLAYECIALVVAVVGVIAGVYQYFTRSPAARVHNPGS